MLLAFIPSVVNATDYTQKFVPAAINGTATWKSPIRYNGEYLAPQVNSKWNEVRNVGTSPHIGIDLEVYDGTPLVAVDDGVLSNVIYSTYNVVSLDVSTTDSYYSGKTVCCHYEHCSSVNPSGTYTEGDIIGYSGHYGQSSNNRHLHFAAHDRNVMSGRLGYRNETLYRYSIKGPMPYTGTQVNDYWEKGKHLDTFSWSTDSQSHVVSIILSMSGPNNNDSEHPSEVKLYYRTTNGGNWSGPVNMSNAGNSNTFKYSFDFATIPNQVPSGSTVQYVIRYKRTNYNTTQYMWAPAKYYDPNSNPNATSYPYGYFTLNVNY